MKTFLLSSWRPIFFRREVGEEGSSPRLCQGLLFGVVALVDLCSDIPSTVKIII